MFPITLNVALRQAEVDQEYFMSSFVEADTKVIRFDVSMDEMPIVDVLNSGDHLIDQHQHCLK